MRLEALWNPKGDTFSQSHTHLLKLESCKAPKPHESVEPEWEYFSTTLVALFVISIDLTYYSSMLCSAE